MGEILIDLIVPHGQALDSTPELAVREGGAPMNAAVAIARLGVSVSFCGVVGDDHFGRRLRALLDREDINTRALRTAKGEPTSIAYAWKDGRGDGHFQLLRLADRMLDPADIDVADIGSKSALLVGSVSLATEPSRTAIVEAVHRAHSTDVPVVFDVNVRPSLWRGADAIGRACEAVFEVATVIKLSLDDARNLWGVDSAEEGIARCAGYPARVVVVTDGSRVVSVSRAGAIRNYPVQPVDAIDPTGAGDAFTGALVCRLVESEWAPPSDADVQFAMMAGALATTRAGALTALPTRSELDSALLRGHP